MSPLTQNVQRIQKTSRILPVALDFPKHDSNGLSTIAFGHHAETCLMRLGKGSSELGAGGMAYCRKWGMGLGRSTEGRLGWAGYEGMMRWIVRPLLDVSKVRFSFFFVYFALMPYRIGFWPLAKPTVLDMSLTRQISNLRSPFAMLFVKCCEEGGDSNWPVV